MLLNFFLRHLRCDIKSWNVCRMQFFAEVYYLQEAYEGTHREGHLGRLSLKILNCSNVKKKQPSFFRHSHNNKKGFTTLTSDAIL